MIRFRVEDGRLYDVRFTGGCPGNLEGIGSLLEGMSLSDVVNRLSGIRCGKKTTSCRDQPAQAVFPNLAE